MNCASPWGNKLPPYARILRYVYAEFRILATPEALMAVAGGVVTVGGLALKAGAGIIDRIWPSAKERMDDRARMMDDLRTDLDNLRTRLDVMQIENDRRRGYQTRLIEYCLMIIRRLQAAEDTIDELMVKAGLPRRNRQPIPDIPVEDPH